MYLYLFFTNTATTRNDTRAIDAALPIYDGGEGSNSRMTMDLEACTYVVGVNSYSNGEVGAYELSVRCPDVRLCRDCEVGSITCGETVDGSLDEGDCALADGTLIDS